MTLWPGMCPLLVTVPCALERKALCCCWVERSVNAQVIQQTDGAARSTVRLMIFCLFDLSIADRGALKASSVIKDLSISSFASYVEHFDTLLGTHTVKIAMFPYRIGSSIIMESHPLSLVIFLLRNLYSLKYYGESS